MHTCYPGSCSDRVSVSTEDDRDEPLTNSFIDEQIQLREQASARKDIKGALAIEGALLAQGVILQDVASSATAGATHDARGSHPLHRTVFRRISLDGTSSSRTSDLYAELATMLPPPPPPTLARCSEQSHGAPLSFPGALPDAAPMDQGIKCYREADVQDNKFVNSYQQLVQHCKREDIVRECLVSPKKSQCSFSLEDSATSSWEKADARHGMTMQLLEDELVGSGSLMQLLEFYCTRNNLALTFPITEHGPAHDKTFCCRVLISKSASSTDAGGGEERGGMEMAVATGKCKRTAMKQAAEQAVNALQMHDPFKNLTSLNEFMQEYYKRCPLLDFEADSAKAQLQAYCESNSIIVRFETHESDCKVFAVSVHCNGKDMGLYRSKCRKIAMHTAAAEVLQLLQVHADQAQQLLILEAQAEQHMQDRAQQQQQLLEQKRLEDKNDSLQNHLRKCIHTFKRIQILIITCMHT